jgi:hypothetical protein
VPHTLWTEIKAHPACDAPDRSRINFSSKSCFEPASDGRVSGILCDLTFQYFPSETAGIEYVLSRGCHYTDSVFTMRRDLSKEIPFLPSLKEITIRPWRMESEVEQRQYVQARNECFPEAPVALGAWQYFMQSPQWSVGTTFAAFDGDELAGNVSVCWDEDENQRSGKKIGFTENIFVRPVGKHSSVPHQRWIGTSQRAWS